MRLRIAWLAAPLCVASAAVAAEQGSIGDLQPAPFDAGNALAISQAAIGRELPPPAFTDQHGRRFTLADLRGRPLVISPIYTSCYHICPTTTSWLWNVSRIAADVVGESAFTVLTVGFDTANDTPERMRVYAQQRGIDSPQWIFASGDAATMGELLREIGFTYGPAAGGFDHMIQTTVVGRDGRVYRQVYGQQFETPQLVDPLKRLVLGQRLEEETLSSVVEQVRLFCTVFDAKSGRYRFDYSIFLSFAIGLLSLGAVAVFIWRAWRAQPRTPRSS